MERKDGGTRMHIKKSQEISYCGGQSEDEADL